MLVALVSWCAPGTASAQTLAVQGERFTVNGVPKFLVMVSYFGGLQRPEALWAQDFGYLESRGVSGIRVFPEWRGGSQTLFSTTGVINQTTLDKLGRLVDKAGEHGLVVDVSFDCGLSGISDVSNCKWGATQHGGIQGVARALAAKPNVLIDVWNEQQLHCKPEIRCSPVDLQGIKDVVKNVKANAVVVVSSSSTEDVPVTMVKTFGFDAVTHHDGRDCPTPCQWGDETDDVVRRLKALLARPPATVAPVYLQEPNRIGSGAGRDSAGTFYSHAVTALNNARKANAAAWTLHVNPDYDLSVNTSFEHIIQASERAFLQDLNSILR
jgi:hypothetical protein